MFIYIKVQNAEFRYLQVKFDVSIFFVVKSIKSVIFEEIFLPF